MSKTPFPEQDPLIALEKAIQLRDAKAVNQWFMEQKEIPASLQIATSSEMPESKYKGWEPLAGTFLRLVQHGESDPPILSYFRLKTYLEGTLFAIQAILSHSDTLTSVENQQKLFHLTQLYGHAIFFSSCDQVTYEILDTLFPSNDQNRPSHTPKVALQQAAELLLKNEKDLKTFLKVSSPIFLSYLLRHLIDTEQTDAFSRLLQHGLSAHYLLRTQPIPQNSLSLLEYAIQKRCFPIALKLLQDGVHFDLPDPEVEDLPRLLVCLELLELEAKETKATTETIQSAPLLEEEKSVNNSARQKIINHGSILLSRCLQRSTANKALIAHCLERGICPTNQQKEQLIQYGVDNSLSATYFFDIFIFESPQEWQKRAEVLTEHSNSEVRRNMFLGLLLAYEKSLSQVPQGVSDSRTEDLNTCRQAFIVHTARDKDNSKELMKNFSIPCPNPILNLLIAGCGRLSTAEDFKRLFTPKVENMPVFIFSACSPQDLSSFILQAVSLDENNYQSFVEAAVKNNLETFFKALKLLQQQSNISESEPPLEPELIEKMLKAISLHKMECSDFLLKLISNENSPENIFYFIDQTGYQPALDHPRLLNLFEHLANKRLLALFPEILPEIPDTFAPLVEATSNFSYDRITRASFFLKYAELTYYLAARPGDPLAHKAVEDILIKLLYLPSNLSRIITDYLPQKGDFPGSIWPQFREQLLSLPIDEKHKQVLQLQLYLPKSADELSTFQPFLKNFDCYFSRESYAVALANIWDNPRRAFKELPYALPLLYHRTVMMAEVKDSKINDVSWRNFDLPGQEEAVEFLFYSGLTGRLPTESRIWAYRRPHIPLDQTRQIVFEWGFRDREHLTERQLTALCTHADAHPVELLYEAAQQEDTALLDFLVGDRKEHKGIGLDINRQRLDKDRTTHNESSVLMVALERDNQSVITRLLLRKAGFPKTRENDFYESSVLLSLGQHFSIYLQAIVAARKEAAETADPALAAHLATISLDAVRVSITKEVYQEKKEEIKKESTFFNFRRKEPKKNPYCWIKLWDMPENRIALNALLDSPGFKQQIISLRCADPDYRKGGKYSTKFPQHTLLEIAIEHRCNSFVAILRELIYQEAEAVIASSALSPSAGPQSLEIKGIKKEKNFETIKDHPRFILYEQLIDLYRYDLFEKSPHQANMKKNWIRILNYLKANPPELTRAFQTQIDKWPEGVAVAALALVSDQTDLTVSEVPAKVQNSQIPAQPDEETKSRESTEISIISASNQTSISSSTRDESSRLSQETTPTDNKDAGEIQPLVMREGNSELEVKEDSKSIIESKTPDNNEAAKDSTSPSSLKSDCIQPTPPQSSSLVDKIPTTDIKSTETLPTPAQPWWKSWWLLPILGLAEGFDLGERWLLPSIENTTMSLWALQVISTVPPAVGGFFFGCVVYWGAINYGASLKEKLPSFLTSSSVLIGLLAAGLLGTPIAVECIPLFLDKWPVLQGYSRYAFAAMVLITGVLVGLLTQLGKSVYHSRWADTLFHHPNSETVSATPNTPLLGSAFQSQS